jgi:mono/diheme cytochrome c family protein
MGCHGTSGEGLLHLGPPLADSDWVTKKRNRLVQVLLHGLEGPLVVSGKTYAPLAVMPGLGTNPAITDQDLADVATYIRNSWRNKASIVTEEQVAKQREESSSRGERLYRAEDFN